MRLLVSIGNGCRHRPFDESNLGILFFPEALIDESKIKGAISVNSLGVSFLKAPVLKHQAQASLGR